LKRFYKTKSILGVCLGMQAIGECFNSPLKNLETVFHGVATKLIVRKKEDKLFKNCPDEFLTGRYHSWVIDEKKVNPDLEIIATDENDLIMAVRHKTYDVCGVQFHPESILSEYGEQVISNWINA